MLLTVAAFLAETPLAQVQTFKELHKVKRKETIFGIARDYGLTVEDIIKANPEMNAPGYELKKGDYIRIPYPPKQAQPAQELSSAQQMNMPTKPVVANSDMRQREIRVGITTETATAGVWWNTIAACSWPATV